MNYLRSEGDGVTQQFPAAPEPFAARKFKRVPITLAGRYRLGARREFPCQTLEVSPDDMLLSTPEQPNLGEGVITHFDELGCFYGAVAALEPSGFRMIMSLPSQKRSKLADQLTWYANLPRDDLPDRRQNERIVPLKRRAVLRISDGREHIVNICDVSVSSASVETALRPSLGSQIMIGDTPAFVIRHSAHGIAAKFVKPFTDAEIGNLMKL